MGFFRFRRRIRIAPGIDVNLNKGLVTLIRGELVEMGSLILQPWLA
jgi:hypothetical protein